MSEIYLSVVIPSYNEMANLQKGVLDKVEHFLNKENFDYEVIIVDDGSNDGSIEFVERFTRESPKFKLIKNQHLGKAGAVTSGMLKTQGKYALFTDMDQAAPIEELNKLLPFVDKYDIVIGSRTATRKGAPFTRQIISTSAVMLRKVLVGMSNLSDTQCGFKLFSRKASDDLFKTIYEFHHGFKKISGSSVTAGFDVELLYIATKKGYKIKEVPVSWLYVETRRVNPITDSINGVIEFLNIGFNRLTGKYKNL